MAAWLFTERILAGKPITIFNGGAMERDFTYVEDIVGGVVRAMQYQPPGGLDVLNLGGHTPVPVMRFVELIEGELGKKAIYEYKEAKTEIPKTFADVRRAKKRLGWEAKVPVE